jgi:hypothetical protein
VNKLLQILAFAEHLLADSTTCSVQQITLQIRARQQPKASIEFNATHR